MNNTSVFNVIIIGGGLAGLTAAIHLSQHGKSILLIEKYTFPHHKVCGEYISNEVLPYLTKLGIDPLYKGAKQISKFKITNEKGSEITSELPLGGFGMSRYALDFLLYEKAKNTATITNETVTEVSFSSEIFKVNTQENNSYSAQFVLGAFGKRSNLDKELKRDFIQQKSYWLGVKAHYEFEMPTDQVELHNFNGGYCGFSKIETGAVNACYLTSFKSFKKFANIDVFQKEVMSKNPHLNFFFSNAKPLFKKPLTISQISFESKKPVESHIFMIGDSAGLIHPLCGNGMAMAIHSAKLFCELFLAEENPIENRNNLEEQYKSLWKNSFSDRLRNGRIIQKILLNPIATSIGFKVAQKFPFIVPKLIKATHGEDLI